MLAEQAQLGNQKLGEKSHPHGGIAQLGERLHGMQEVIGSIPFTSTIECAAGAAKLMSFLGRDEVLTHVLMNSLP